MRMKQRPRRYVARHWLLLLRPVLRYSESREAFILRVVGKVTGPVLRVNRRGRRKPAYAGAERRGIGIAA